MSKRGSEQRTSDMYKAAWLHFERNYPQKRIAALFRVDKATVARWIKDAIERGLVSITVNPPPLEELEIRMRAKFGIRTVRVIPSFPLFSSVSGGPATPAAKANRAIHDEAKLVQAEALGKAAAALIAPMLTGNITLGLGGGTGVAAFARHLCHHCPMIAIRLLALAVSSREPFEYCATSVTAICTSLLRTEFRRRASQAEPDDSTQAPKVEGHALRLPERSGDFKTMLAAANDYYESAMTQVDTVVTGIGAIETCWVLTEEERAKLAGESAAKGEILYDFYAAQGTPIRIAPSAAVFPFGINRLRKMVSAGKEVIIISARKARATYHALASKQPFMTGIVSDEETASQILRFRDRSKR